jgi:hypothetical protein
VTVSRPVAASSTGVRRPSRHRRPRAVGVVSALVVALLAATTGVADASSYRFWTYWTGDTGAWAFSSVGPSRVPPDGSVEGWRFEVSAASSSSQPPRAAPSFATLCAGKTAGPGQKLVGIVIDYGTTADAPAGQHPPAAVQGGCAVVADAANGYQILAGVSRIRVSGGLVCGVDGYPSSGCGEVARDATPTPTPSHSTPPTSVAVAAGGPTATATPAGPTADGTRTGGATATPRPTTHRSARPSGGAAAGPTPSASSSPAMQALAAPAADGAGSPWGALTGIAVLALVVAMGWFVARRRRT